MKKVLIAVGILTSVMVACSPKASKTPAPPIATEAATTLVGTANTGGLLISSAKCTKCHGNKTDHVPKQTFTEQEKLMHAMAKKAKLSDQETADLMAYVMANAKK